MFYVLVIFFIVIIFILDHVLNIYYSILLFHGNVRALVLRMISYSAITHVTHSKRT